MKKFIFIAVILVISVSCAQAGMLNSFSALMDALKEGRDIRMVVDYGKCDLYTNGEKAENSPQAIGGMNIDVFEYFSPELFGNEKGFLAFSHRSFINIRDKYLYNYVKVKVYDDGVVEVNAQYLLPDTFETVMDETFMTTISDKKPERPLFFIIDTLLYFAIGYVEPANLIFRPEMRYGP